MISTTDASQPSGRLANVGLTGGFGSLTLGQIWNAAYNHVGVITDKSFYFGNAGTGYRHGNALSYAFSSGALGFQLDLISDGGESTGKAIDKTEFGVTIGLGEVGRVALAHTNQRDQMVMDPPTMQDWINTFEPNTPTTVGEEGTANIPYDPGTDGMPEMFTVDHDDDADTPAVQVRRIMVFLTGAQNIAANVDEGVLTAAGLLLIERTNNRYHATGALPAECQALIDADDGTEDDCVEVAAFVREVATQRRDPGAAATVTTVTETFFAEAVRTAPTDGDPEVDGEPNTPTTVGEEGTAAGFGDPPQPTPRTVPGFKRTHVAVEFSVGAVTPYLGYSKNKMNGATQDTKTTHYGLSGGLGDTGVGYLVAGRSIKNTDGTKTSPWLVNVWKDLGGGATVIFGHGNDDNGMSGRSRVGLHVNF